jgi:hypothetical protein
MLLLGLLTSQQQYCCWGRCCCCDTCCRQHQLPTRQRCYMTLTAGCCTGASTRKRQGLLPKPAADTGIASHPGCKLHLAATVSVLHNCTPPHRTTALLLCRSRQSILQLLNCCCRSIPAAVPSLPSGCLAAVPRQQLYHAGVSVQLWTKPVRQDRRHSTHPTAYQPQLMPVITTTHPHTDLAHQTSLNPPCAHAKTCPHIGGRQAYGVCCRRCRVHLPATHPPAHLPKRLPQSPRLDTQMTNQLSATATACDHTR